MAGADESKMVVFHLGGEQFCAPIARVIEIHRPQRLTRMPRTPSFIRGIFNLRGRVLPVLDAKMRLGMAHSDEAPAGRPLRPHEVKERIMVVEALGDQAGIMVDEVLEVMLAREDQIQSPEGVMTTAAGRFLKGVVNLEERMVLLLDLDRMLAFGEEGA